VTEFRIHYTRDGYHEISRLWGGEDICLIVVRPVGTIEFTLSPERPFSAAWIPDLIEALKIAKDIAGRAEPWKRYPMRTITR
jgi:hypothetical protein